MRGFNSFAVIDVVDCDVLDYGLATRGSDAHRDLLQWKP